MQVEEWFVRNGIVSFRDRMKFNSLWDGSTFEWVKDTKRMLNVYMGVVESIMATKRNAPVKKETANEYRETDWISLDLRNKADKAKAGAWMIIPENILQSLLLLGEEGGTLTTMPDKDGGFKTLIFVPLKGGKKQLGLRANAKNAVDATACCLYKYAVMLDDIELEVEEEEDEFGFG